MKILLVVDSLNEGTGGTSYSVSELSDALSRGGAEVRLVSQDHPDFGAIVEPQLADARISIARPLPFRLGSYSSDFRRELLAGAEWASVIHGNGMWLPTNRMTRNAAIRAKRPLMISTRGMFENWSMRHKSFRKRVAWSLFEEQNLKSAACLHATSEEEAQTLRSRLGNPIAVIPNGVVIPDTEGIHPRAALEERFPQLANKRWLLFLSRLHPKKGLPELLESWKNIAAKMVDWHLILAGGDEEHYREKLELMARNMGIQNRITFAGNLTGSAKAAVFANTEVFVLPSHSENFGRVIAEALSHGVPVITTKQTPWRVLETENCGWWIDDDVAALENALKTALSTDPGILSAMGAHGKQVVRERFTWEAIAREFELVYEWMLNTDSQPPASIRMRP